MRDARKGAKRVSHRALGRGAFSWMRLCERRSRLENASAFEQSNRPSHQPRSTRAAGLLQPVSRGGPPAVVLSFAKIPNRNRQSSRKPRGGERSNQRIGCRAPESDHLVRCDMWNAPMLHGNIAPPMPAKRALAALDQPAPPIIGPPSRIPRDPPAPLDAATNMDGHFRPLFPVENHHIARLELSLHCIAARN
jgi:hypothetical protein